MSRLGPTLLALIALSVATYAVYHPVGRFGFVGYDDPFVVTDNPHVNAGLTAATARWALTGFAVGHWEPLTWWSLQADVSLWHGRPGPMHVENAALHAAGSALLFGLLASATGAAGRSAVVAAVFAVHPMHVESVAWITERRDVLSTPLLLAAVWAYTRYVRAADARRSWAWYAGFLGLYGLSLSAKATGMTLPAVLLLWDVWPLRRDRTRWPTRVADKVAPTLLAVANAAAALAAQRAAGAASSLAGLPVGDRLSNAAVTAVIYVAKLAVPTGLAAFYPHPGTRPAAAVAAAVGLLVLTTAVVWRQRHRRPYLMVGWGWFLVTLLPVSGIVQSGPQAMADRYSYVPSIGLTVAAVWLAADALPAGSAATATVAVVVALYAALACRQVRCWRDTATLFAHAAAVTDGNWMAHVFLGQLARDRGDPATAADLFRRAVAEQPNAVEPLDNLAHLYLDQHRPADALACYRQLVRLVPDRAVYHVQSAVALATLGQRDAAIAECRTALAIDPANPNARAGLADLLSRPPEDR